MTRETPSGIIGRLARRQMVASAYSAYGVLVLEHERLRRTRWRGELRATWRPDAAAWGALRFLASVHEPAFRSTQALLEFFEAHVAQACRPRGAGEPAGGLAEPPLVPWQAWREALRAGIDLVADVLAAHGADLPWGRGQPRVPRNRHEFEAICAFLRDLPPAEDHAPLSALVESARLPALPHKERAPGHRVTFYRGRQVLSVDGVRIALPAGRELLFLELLAERRASGQVTPTEEHGINWKCAADKLRARIRKAAGANLLRCVVMPANRIVGGYRLAPGVRVRRD